MSDSNHFCKICNSNAKIIGTKEGKFRKKMFEIAMCGECQFAWVTNPETDYENLYNKDYYLGKGADPLVSYVDELENPKSSVRQYEWRGVFKVISKLFPISKETQWLDFGCGNGGLVRYVSNLDRVQIFGYEMGAIADMARSKGIPILFDKDLEGRKFDIITSIEVLEHVTDPLETLRKIAGLLKPGGLFFFTTGNVVPFKDKLLDWTYVVPEIHVSFYSPKSLMLALEKVGLTPSVVNHGSGYSNIYAFKVLKNLGFKNTKFWQKIVPWPVLKHVLEYKFQLGKHPVAHK